MGEETNALVQMGELGIVQQDDTIFNQLATGAFLPRIMLMQSGSVPVQEGKIGAGHFGLVSDKGDPCDIGEISDMLLIHWRPKAMRLEGSEIVEDIYDVKDPAFESIRKDSEVKEDGKAAMYGAEFLVYVFSQKKFATFFCGNPTLRRESGTIKGLLGKATTFEKKLIKANNRSWFGLKVYECKTPVDIPAVEEIKAEVMKFQNPTPRKREAAPEVQSRAR